MLHKHKRWFRSSRVKFPFVSMSASWFFGVNISDLNFWVQIDFIKQPIKNNSVGSGNMSQCRASSLYDHLDHCFVVFKHIQQSFLTRRIDVWGNKINDDGLLPLAIILITASRSSKNLNKASKWESFAFVVTWSTLKNSTSSWLTSCLGASVSVGFRLTGLAELVVFWKNAILQKNRSQRSRARTPSMRRPASKKITSDSAELLETEVFFAHPTYGNRRSTSEKAQNSPWIWFKVFKAKLESCPHDNVLCDHPSDECKKSHELNVCRKPSSIWWLYLQDCSQNRECLVHQFRPNVIISRRFDIKHLTILIPFSVSFLEWWSVGRSFSARGAKVLSGSAQGIYPPHRGSWSVSGSRNSRLIREMERNEMKWMEMSKRSEATINEMTLARATWDEGELEPCRPLSQCRCDQPQGTNSQGTLTLTTRKRDYENKQAQLWFNPHRSRVTGRCTHECPHAWGHSACCWACRSVCRIHLLSMHQTYALSDLYGNSC